jgi:Zn-dependent M28 family amino/carboxypeptidase
MRVLSADAMQGRLAQSEGSSRARAYIAEQAAILNDGLSPEEHPFTRTSTRRNGETIELAGTNLITTLPGRKPGGPVLEVTAHYDHLGMSGTEVFNGADDNASGVGALFAILKSFKDHPPEHEVRLIWLDTEERGLAGAHEYVADHVDDRPRVNLNLDMIAQSETGEIYMSGAYHTPALKPLVELASQDVPIRVIYGHDRPEDGQNDWSSSSDHGAFHAVGIPFVYFGVADHEHYHRTTDTFETIPLSSYHAAVQLSVKTAHVLDDNLDAIAVARTVQPDDTSTPP